MGAASYWRAALRCVAMSWPRAGCCWHCPIPGVCSVLLCRAWSCRKGSKQGSMAEGRASTVLLWPAWSSWPRSSSAWAWGCWWVLLAVPSPWFRHPPWRWSAAASWLSAFAMWTRTARREQLEEISPGERFLSVFFTSSTGAVAVLTLLARHPLLPPWIGCNSRALWNGDLIKLVASDTQPHTPLQCSHAVTCDAVCGHGILMDQESLWNSSLPICGS